MGKRFVSGITLGLLFIGMLTLAFSSGSWPRIWSVHDRQQLVVAATSLMSASAEVRFDPKKYAFITESYREWGVGVGYRFNATVELYDVAELMAWQVRVYFNNTILNATNAYYHPDEPIHTVSHMPLSPVIKNDYNATHGYVQQGISAIYPNYVNVTAENYPEGVGIFIIEFKILNAPSNGDSFECNLVLDNLYTYLLWKDGETEITCEKVDGWYCIKDPTKVPINYPTIQKAINALDPSVTEPIKNAIFVYNGTYYENVVVNKTVMLLGQNPMTTIINGSGGKCIHIDRKDNVVIDGFTVAGGSHGVFIYNSRYTTITANNFRENNYGIYVFSENGYCDNGIVEGSNVTGNNYGIYAYGLAGEWVRFNIDLWKVVRNNISGNVHGIYAFACGGWWGYPYSSYINRWIIKDNYIAENNGYGIYAYGSTAYVMSYKCDLWLVYRNTISLNGEAGVSTGQQADGWTIDSNNITKNKYGIHLGGRDNVLRRNDMNNNTYNFGVDPSSSIQDVDASNTVNGKPVYYWINKVGSQVPTDAGYIALVDSANITVGNFNLSHNKQGIMLIRTKNTTLENIYVSKDMYGIYLQESSNFTIYSSQAINNTYGIYLQDSANGTLSYDKAISNTYGIYLKNSSNSTITGNNVEENAYGVYLSESSNNTFYHNNFDQNTKQALTEGTSVNAWDKGYPSGGNYWSDHTGPDECKGIYQNETGNDGIVDANMTISQNNIDYYPLSAPWSSPIHILMPGNTTYRELACEEGNINLTFTLDFTASWIGYSLDGQANVTITGNTTLTDLAYGPHHIIVYANDTSGNMYSSAKVYFTITFLTDLNYDRTVDVKDLAMTCYAYGSVPGEPRWKCKLDVNRDGIIDIEDIAMVAEDYGKTWY